MGSEARDAERMFADANSGMLDRDIELAEHRAGSLRSKYGLPSGFHVNYAESRPENLARLVHVLTKADLITGSRWRCRRMTRTSRRSSDPDIKLERYYALASEFRSANLPLYTDVIVGLRAPRWTRSRKTSVGSTARSTSWPTRRSFW